MNVVQIGTDFVRVGQVTLSTGEFYTLRPSAPRLPAWATMLRHERDALTYVSDGKTQREFTGDVGQLEALLDDQAALAADLAALRAPPVPSLDERRAQATLLIDGAAERARLAFITAGSGQALVYELVRLQAADYAAHYTVESPPAVGTYPLLEAQIGTVVPVTSDFASDIADAAAVVATTAQAWITVAAAIERVRLGAKRAVARAADVAAIDAILAGLNWPQP
jgi:hypothetical protein